VAGGDVVTDLDRAEALRDMNGGSSFQQMQRHTFGAGVRAFSLRQPWADAVLFGGKRIENRVDWTYAYPPSKFRGWCFLHAAKGMTRGEYGEVTKFCEERGATWRPPPVERLRRGGLIGRMRVIGCVRDDGAVVIDAASAGVREPVRDMREDERVWYMGKFALVLADVQLVTYVPMAGALGFFKVPDDLARLALGVVV
jgi:hypothetical protein